MTGAPLETYRYCTQCGHTLTACEDESGEEHLRCDRCGWVWYDPPVPVVLVVVMRDDGQIVYTRKKGWEPNRWSVVSGFIPKGERAESTALREVKEETCLDAELMRYLISDVYDARPDQLAIAFLARVTGGTLQAADDVAEAEFGPLDPKRVRPGSTDQMVINMLMMEREGRSA